MAENRRGLGRGLSALLGDADEGVEGKAAAAAADGQREVPIELIHRNPDQPRQHFSEAEIEELTASIRDKGVLQPILVRPSPKTPGEYEIVAGERRWRAAQKAGLAVLPVLVRDMPDDQAFEIAVVENVQREDLNAMEEAQAYASLMRRMAYTQDKAAAAVGKSRSHVANTLRLLQLPDSVQDHVLFGRLTAGHARAILASAFPEVLAETIVEKGLSVRDAEALAKRKGESTKKGSGPRRAPKDADTAAVEADLEDVLGMTVELTDRGGAGELKIKYASLDQLDELIRETEPPMIVAEGSRVRLRSIGVRDLKAASAHRFTLSIVEPAINLKRLRVLYDRHGFWAEDFGAVAIEAVDGKRLLGTLQFYRSGPGVHGYEIGYLLHDPDDQGKGYASEAVRLFSDYLFEERPGCHRLQLIIEIENVASARLAEACGYASEGTLRKAGYSEPDEPSDCFIYSRVRD